VGGAASFVLTAVTAPVATARIEPVTVGHGFSCGPALGSRMRVARIRLDRHGTIRFLRATFVQRCKGHAEALRGRIAFRRGY
jgi:hypothetical protein